MSEKTHIFILALDGVPYTFLNEIIALGYMPHLEKIVNEGVFKSLKSVIPPVSSSAWASFITGQHPNEHGILSFTERDPSNMEWFTPDSRNLKSKTHLEKLSEKGKRVFSMNLPVTYPPKPVNGISICGFLGNDIEKGTFPESEGRFLKQRGYRIDADIELAKTDLASFLRDLNEVLEKRIEMMWYYYEKEHWDFFLAHIMETDRLHHFTWEFMENKDPLFVKIYEKFYSRLDDLIGEVAARIKKETALVLLSDHGFTTLKQEVYLNRWLWENDYLKFIRPIPVSLKDMHPSSKAYALYPGRIFINLKGREKYGSINPGQEFESLKEKLKRELLEIHYSVDNEAVINSIKSAAEVYDLKKSYAKEIDLYLADLFLFANAGYDLKGQLWSQSLFSKTIFNGMHTFNNAFVIAKGIDLGDSELSIADLIHHF